MTDSPASSALPWVAAAAANPTARLVTGPRGGQITTACYATRPMGTRW
ncbi:MAG TPA: hypothetical protein VGP04_03550 [Pseudonocardiaceae bacterium]|nr:hypothetical protein [Pseudonocardiaceae bacterium]